jgi:hypothetical protein
MKQIKLIKFMLKLLIFLKVIPFNIRDFMAGMEYGECCVHTECPRRKGQYSGKSQYRSYYGKSVYVHVFHSELFSLYSSKICDKKEILRTVSNIDVYCSSDRFGAVYLV